MSEVCETETVQVEYYLDVQKTGASGTQTWGPFSTRQSADATAVALASVAENNSLVIRKEFV